MGEFLDGHDALLGRLYEAVTAPSGFQDFIRHLAEVFHLKAVTMVVRHAESQEVKGLWMHGIEHKWVESYALEYGRSDLLAAHVQRAPIAHFYASNLDLEQPGDFAATPFAREWLAPQGVAYAAGATVLQEGGWLTQMILQRGTGQQPFGRDEIARLDALMPHLQRAMQMRQRFAELQFGQNFLIGGLDVLTMPTLLFDESARVAHRNRSGERLLADGQFLFVDGGHLQARERELTARINLEIYNAVRLSRGESCALQETLLLPRPQQLPLMLLVAPLRLPAGTPGQGGALLFVFDPARRPSLTAELVRGLFQLSSAEAQLAVALCGGRTLDDVAQERGTSINTVKSQLKSLFQKTGTRRQSELVSLLLASPAYFLSQPGA